MVQLGLINWSEKIDDDRGKKGREYKTQEMKNEKLKWWENKKW